MAGTPVIEVTSTAHKRHVRVLAPQKGTYQLGEFETAWPAQLLYALAELKGQWFVDSYCRFEHPNYTQKQVDTVLGLYGITLGDEPLLDFGCGFGASSYCMIRRGARRIVGAELEKSNTDFASRFFSEMGLADRVQIRCGDIVPELQSGSFSLIWLQAVMEHLLPEERRRYLRRFWEALAAGGYLIITETPNRIWPVEAHTTGLWWLPWMQPARVFSKMRAQPKYASHSDQDFYRAGIIGSSYSEILECLGRPSDLRELSLEVKGYLAFLYARAQRRSTARTAAIKALGFAEWLSRTSARRPITAFMPFLNHLVFQKAAGGNPRR